MSLYNEERPHSFVELEGQEDVKKSLSTQLVTGKTKGAYLFSGIRGTGKTTVARILAQSLNCEHLNTDGSPCGHCQSCEEALAQQNMDIYELDAASNNSVDDIRGILEQVQYTPIRRKKVFILDECHMLSTAASNALLKVLEEPPTSVVFILCTTEKHKVLPTIISRCLCFDFKKIGRSTISDRIMSVCKKRGVNMEKSAADIIAKAANGGMRDAYSMLDRFIEQKNIDAETVATALGITTDEAVFAILNGIADREPVKAVEALRNVTSRGGSIPFLIESVFEVLLDLVDFESTGDVADIIGTEEYRNNITQLSFKLDTELAFRTMDSFRNVYRFKNDTEISIISAIIGIIYQNSEFDRLKNEVECLRSELMELKSSGTNPEIGDKSTDIISDGYVSEDCSNCSTNTEQMPENEATKLPEAISNKTSADYNASFNFNEEVPAFYRTSPSDSLSGVLGETADSPNDFVPANDSIPFEEFVKQEEFGKNLGDENKISSTAKSETLEPANEASDEEFNFFSDEFARLGI